MTMTEYLNRSMVRDATAADAVSFNIRNRDMIDAVPKNGKLCVAGKCVGRALDAKAVWFYRSVCYVQWDEGQPILRYKNSAKLIRHVIDPLDQDREGDIKPGIYQLLPPTTAQRLGRDRTSKNPGSRNPRVDRGHKQVGRIWKWEEMFGDGTTPDPV
jgi:hypothetical protein